MVAKLADWLDERLGWRKVWDTVFLRKIPKVNWLYTLGSATLFVAAIQGATGILLTIYYVPSPDHAYDSILYITNEVTGGWLIRGLHHYASSALVILCVLHMLRIIIHGAYKYPRELTWITGVFLLLIMIGFGFTGYLLPWDQKAYWATAVGTQMAGTPPFVGDFLLNVIRGGKEITEITLARFFGVHIWVLPTFLITFIGVHIYLVIRNGISASLKDKNKV
jgi:quinol-cytochrome oxidoreductase complex cytochrome b subunit